MRSLYLPLFFLIPNLNAMDFGIDAMGFGVSHHSNKEYPWKEFNPGLGGSLWCSPIYGLEGFIAMGAYKNSTCNGSFFQQAGLRYTYDFSDPWSIGAFVSYGVLTGYDDKAVTPLAGLSLGYNWLYLESGYKPTTDGTETAPGTAVIAGWIRIRVKTW